MKWRIPLGILSAVLAVWGILPLLTASILNVGVIVPTAIGLLGLLAAIGGRTAKQVAKGVIHAALPVRITAIVLGAVVMVLCLLFIAVSVVMAVNAVRVPPDNHVTLIVPGAKLYGEQPSDMLLDRLRIAADYLKANPNVPCVVSGGKGEGEMRTEAETMYTYLVSVGIDPERIYMEARSTNTYENMQFSYEVIKRHHLPTRVVIATQEFHQFRCAQYAKEAALTPVGTATCGTPWHLFLSFWVREFAGINRMWLLGY